MCKHRTLRFLWGAAIILGACALLPIRPASAQAPANAKWIVTEISGQARERGTDGNWHALARGSVLSEGRTVETGPNARLVLMHHEDLVTVSPNSAFDVPHNSDPAVSIRFIQKLGTMLFRVEHLPQRRFEVDAPHLVAVVKGTVFTVSATKSADAVHVAEGAVQVSTLLTHQVELIRPGEVAVVSAAGRDLTVLGSPKPGLLHKSKYDDPADDALGTTTADAGGHSPQGLTHTVGERNLDLPAVSKGLLGTHGQGNALGHSVGYASANGNGNGNGFGQGSAAGGNAAAIAHSAFAIAGNPNAHGGNPNAGGGNPNAIAAAASINAGGGNPNAGGGNANAHGGNPNAGGGASHGHGKP